MVAPPARRLLFWLCVLLVASCSSGGGPEGPFAGRNVVLIVLDTTRLDHLGLGGYEKPTTPFLDSLASEAVVFDQAYAASSWTAPSTASIFTSLYPDQHGVKSGYVVYQRASEEDPELRLNRIPAGAQTLPEMLQRAGYRTFGVADNLNICERLGFARGFDHFQSWSYEGGRRVNRQLTEWKKGLRASSRPFFLYVQYMDPHKPYNLREPYYQLEGTVAADFVEEAARYDSELRYLDGLIESIFDELELDANTLVILTADHGEEFGDHGKLGHAGGLHQELVHVPLFVLGRDAEGRLDFEPGRSARKVSNLDIMPTLRELLELPAAEYAEGRSLVPALAGERDVPRGEGRVVFAHRSLEVLEEKLEFYSIHEGHWQLIQNPVRGTRELYDLSSDPGGLHDVSQQQPEVVERLSRQLQAFRERPLRYEREFAEPLTLDQERRRELGRLGYAE